MVQPYCEAKDITWPLTEAGFRLFETEAKAGNSHGLNNMGHHFDAAACCELDWGLDYVCRRLCHVCFARQVLCTLLVGVSSRNDRAAFALITKAKAAGSARRRCVRSDGRPIRPTGLLCR